MHFVQFGGMIPKVHPKKLGDKYSVLAQDMDIYGGRFQPLPELGEQGVAVTVDGEVFVGEPRTLHYQDGVYVGFSHFTTTAPDYTNRLGENTFFFVGEDKQLYRQSIKRITQKKKPILVGMQKPDCKHKPTAETLSDQGCVADNIDLLCVPMYDRNCGDKIPFNTAFCYTYVNSCGEESQPSYPSNHIEFYDGDAVKVVANDKPPANAKKRRWYMLVGDSDGLGHWLYIGEHSTKEQAFYNNNCINSIGEELNTESDGAPPTCVSGVAAVGDNQIMLWQGKSVYFSQPNRQHAFDPSQEYRLMYNVLRAEEVTSPIEGNVHHTILALTDGLHYIINTNVDAVNIQEVEVKAPAYNGEAVCVAEHVMFFVSPNGLYEFTEQGVKLITGQFFTEREWLEYAGPETRIAFYDDKIHGVGRINWIMNFSDDDRRDPSFVVTTERASNVYAHHQGGLVFVMKVGSGINCRLRKWGLPSEPNRCAVWRSPDMVMPGLWRPTTLKVVSSDYMMMSAGAEEALAAYKNFEKKYANVSAETFIRQFPQYKAYVAELTGKRHSIEVIVYADGREYYRRDVSTNKPFLLPRKYRAITWAVEVRSRITIDEIHVQTSRETLTEG